MPPFRPLPFLRSSHLQTVLGAFWNPARRNLPARLAFVPLPDGDDLAIHLTTPRSWQPGLPVAVLLHGLGGCHQSGYMVRVSNRLAARGLRTVAVDLRGAGAGAGRASRLYHAGCSADIRPVLDFCQTQAPGSPLVLLGFSMGGNIALKLAGEMQEADVPALKAVAAVAPPIDLVRCSDLLQKFPFYDRFLVRHLLAQVRRHHELRPHLPPTRFPRRLSVRGFDDLYTAPRSGFRGVLDYYQRASALPLISRIRIPALLLTARDDPFICVTPFEELPPHPLLQIHIAPHGGHLGFLGWDGSGGVRWGERFVEEWVCQRLGIGRS